jgi:hypothetical protein
MKKQWLLLAGLVGVAIVIIAVVAMTLRSPQQRQVTVAPTKSKRLLDMATSRPASAVDFKIAFADNPATTPRTRLYFPKPLRPVAGLPPAGELAQLPNGASRIDLSDFPDGDHHLYIVADGHAPQWRRMRIRNKEIVQGMEEDVTLHPSQYVTIRWAYNTSGKPELTGPNVVTGRSAITHFGQLRYFGMDWQLWQKDPSHQSMFGDVPMLEFHRVGPNMGFCPAEDGATFDQLTVAPPPEQYEAKSIEAKPGLLLYCRVSGNTPKPPDRGYGKILIESVSTTRPTDLKIAEDKFP